MERARSSRTLGFVLAVAGLYVLALPLVFTIFLHETEDAHLALRVALAVAWFLCALLIGAVALVNELDAIGRRAGEVRRRRRRAARRRELAALSSIEALLQPGATGLPDSFRFAAFIPDKSGTLRPVLEPRPQPWQRWAPGCGVVGIAWVRKRGLVQARGEQTLDPALGLTKQQRRHYKDLKYVAGRAIFDEDEEPVGVLSVSSTEDDGSAFQEEGGLERFRLLASDMGILLGDARPADR